MKTLTLTYLGRDDNENPVYLSGARLYVDVDHRAWRPASICTKLYNDFNGEPDHPVSADVILEFIPRRQVRQLVGPLPLDIASHVGV